MPTGTLPESGKKLWESVYDTALKGSCKGDKGCAAGSAWKAVKNAGWVKDSSGNWHKKSVAEEFSLTIVKAAYEKSENRMNFLAVGSDTDEDSYNDNMTMTLFNDFLRRIQMAEMPPEQFRSDFWKGGLPYISLSHYPDLDGKAVPGIVEAVYVDGNRLKAKGYFLDTPLGRACFKATCEDLYGKKPHKEGPIRISIAFLDYSHRHKSNGFVFTRSEDEPICIECLKRSASNEGKEFLLGHLIHLALTRVPVNQRTSLEVRSMSINTRKDDALSIVGEDEEAKSLIDAISKEAALVGKSELVIKSDLDVVTEDVVVVEEAKTEKKDEEEKEDEKEEEKKEMYKSEAVDLVPVVEAIQSLRSLVEGMQKVAVVHPLDSVISELKSKYDEIIALSATEEEKLRSLQEPYNTFSQAMIALVRSSVPVEKAEIVSEKSEVSAAAIEDAVMKRIGPELEEIKSMLRAQPVTQSTSPADLKREDINELVRRRSLVPAVPEPTQAKPGVVKYASISEIVERTTK